VCLWNWHFNRGDFAGALRTAEQYKAELERSGRVTPGQMAQALMAIGKPALSLGRLEVARRAFADALGLLDKSGSAGSALAAELHGRLGETQSRLGNCEVATEHLDRAVELWQSDPSRHLRSLALAHNALSILHQSVGRYELAERGFARAIADARSAAARIPAANRDLAVYLANSARLYQLQHDPGRMLEAARQALEVQNAVLKSDDPDRVQSMVALAGAFREARGRAAEGIPYLKRALALAERHFGERHTQVASVLVAFANTNAEIGRYEDALRQLRRALAIREAALTPGHPAIASALDYTARVLLKTGQVKEGLEVSRRAAEIVAERMSAGRSFVCTEDVLAYRGYFERHLNALRLAIDGKLGGEALDEESFRMAQWASGSSAAVAVSRMAARFTGGDDARARRVRQQQDDWLRRRELEKLLFLERSKPSEARETSREQSIQSEIARLAGRLQRVDHLVTANPLHPADVQSLIGADEVVLAFYVGKQQSYVFAITSDAFRRHVIPIGSEEMARKVASFRTGLGTITKQDGSGKTAKSAGASGLFDIGRAHRLYRQLLGPVEGLLGNKKHILLVPSAALTSLPFHLLVTRAPEAKLLADGTKSVIADYRGAAWLIRTHAITVLPSVSNLKAFRVQVGSSRGTKAMIGFGDPVFERGSNARSASATSGNQTRSTRSFSRFAPVDLEQLSRGLAPLPETAKELARVAKTLNASPKDIYLGRKASEAVVRRLELSSYRVVYFATHGLVAGEVANLDEPALVLSLPLKPGEEDDGLLTPSEVAQLRLDADWVVLSACNTAAPDRKVSGKPDDDAEAFSGLARAFFYAGARALLVTHWEAYSNAAARLTARTFEIYGANPAIGRSQALRAAMLELLDDTSDPTNSYPGVWAPFQFVGRGSK
jgi:CHAT domain-containing protein/tetratricopeptide (TPR) repeat protein